MRNHGPDASAGPADIPPAEKLACEWEARHDVAARGRRVDPAAALRRYLTHAHVEEELGHRDRSAHGSVPPPQRPRDVFATRHPLAASLLRWGEDPR
jgi:hypothetical protein